MNKNIFNEIANNEFKSLNKTLIKEIETPKIYILSNNDEIINKIKDVAEDREYEIIGISSQYIKGIEELKNKKANLVFLDTSIEDKTKIKKIGKTISKLNIPLLYILDNYEEELKSNYGYILNSYTLSEINFAIEMSLKKYEYNLNLVKKLKSRTSTKNIELGIEKFYAILLISLSVILIIAGITSRNVTFIQWIIFIPSAIMLILAIISLKDQKEVKPFEIPPFVSIFIPAHNEENTIEKTVRSIAGMEYSLNGKSNYEIIVINDGSTDKTGEILTNLKKEFDNVKIITRNPPKSGKGKGFALNDALILAKGSIIGVFDADTQVEKDFLEKIIPYLNDAKVAGVQSRVRMYNKDENFLANMQDVEFSGFGNILRAKDIMGFDGFLGGNGQFAKKEAIEKAGKWDGFAVTEDLNLSIKMALNGEGIRYCPDVAIYQEAITEWKPFLRQRIRWAIGVLESLFIYSSRVIFSKIPPLRKIGLITHISTYAFNLFIFVGFIIFIVNLFGWFILGIPTIIRMEAPLAIGIISAVAFFPGIAIALLRDDKKYITFIKDLVGYWLYCFHLIPLFFMTIFTMITRKNRRWAKTTHKGD